MPFIEIIVDIQFSANACIPIWYDHFAQWMGSPQFNDDYDKDDIFDVFIVKVYIGVMKEFAISLLIKKMIKIIQNK